MSTNNDERLTSCELLKRTFPGLPEDKVDETQRNFEAYVELAWRIWKRLQSDPTTRALLEEVLELQRKRGEYVQLGKWALH